VVTIPSPNRRKAMEQGNGWVFDSVPLVLAKNAGKEQAQTETEIEL